MGRAFHALPRPPTRPPVSLYSPATSRRFCAVLRPADGIFAPVSTRAEHTPKRKTSVKAIYVPVTAFCALMAIPIFPHRQTAHSGPQAAKQGIKQPRPAPLWSKPRYYHLLRASDRTAQRSAVWSYQAQRGPSHSLQWSTPIPCFSGHSFPCVRSS